MAGLGFFFRFGRKGDWLKVRPRSSLGFPQEMTKLSIDLARITAPLWGLGQLAGQSLAVGLSDRARRPGRMLALRFDRTVS